jgi:hypothetical protein
MQPGMEELCGKRCDEWEMPTETGCKYYPHCSRAKRECLINVNKVDYIIVLENSQNLKTAERIVLDSKCENKNIEILTLNSCQSMNIKDDNNIDYLGIMKSNLENLKKVLGYEFA